MMMKMKYPYFEVEIIGVRIRVAEFNWIEQVGKSRKKKFQEFLNDRRGQSERPSSGPLKQRPAPPVSKKPVVPKPAPKYDQSRQTKPEPGKPEVLKVANKSSEVFDAAPVEASRNKPEVKKQEEDKKPPATTESASGHYELNERMTRMVETELRDIMIKVWQELPDNPSDEVEGVVVDKLRNKLSDNLRNVLGLNVTKRLLNIHNPLYVKVQFSGKPEKVYLGEFLKKYNFIAFKRIEKTDNMFAAQVKTINDFDKICAEKEVKCGNIKVIVNPMYKFTKCPPNLVSSFYDEDVETSDDATTENNEKLNKNDKQITEKGSTKEMDNTPKAKATEKAETTIKANEVAKEKVTNISDNNSIPAKTNENKVVNKTENQNKVENRPVTEAKTVNKPTISPKNTVTESKANINQKSNENKVINKQVGNKVPIEKTIEKKDGNSVQNKAPVKKVESTPIKATKVEPKMAAKGNKSKVNNDYDELDDNDILALMSEGIVLDEWSGSED